MYFYATSNCFKYKCNALNENLDYDLMDFIFKKNCTLAPVLQVFCTVDQLVPERRWLFLGPVIHWGGDSGIVVLNIRCSGSWGREIKEKEKFPFEADEKFTIEIIFREDRYEVCGF